VFTEYDIIRGNSGFPVLLMPGMSPGLNAADSRIYVTGVGESILSITGAN